MSSSDAAPRNRTLLLVILGIIFATAAIAFAVIASPSGSHGKYQVTDGALTIGSDTIGALGNVLVTDQGFALYMFPPDEQANVTCEGRCALNWPPIIIPEGATLEAGAGVDASLLSETISAEGTRVASYNGWPLYTYLGDVSPGTATGQAQYLDGGYWYVLRTNGEFVTPGQGQ